MEFSPLWSENNAVSSETFAFFETTISFSGARNISFHALAATSSGIKRAKNMEFSPLCSENNALSSETYAFFETTIYFSGVRNISVHALAGTSSGIRTRQRCKNMNG